MTVVSLQPKIVSRLFAESEEYRRRRFLSFYQPASSPRGFYWEADSVVIVMRRAYDLYEKGKDPWYIRPAAGHLDLLVSTGALVIGEQYPGMPKRPPIPKEGLYVGVAIHSVGVLFRNANVVGESSLSGGVWKLSELVSVLDLLGRGVGTEFIPREGEYRRALDYFVNLIASQPEPGHRVHLYNFSSHQKPAS